MGIYTVLRVLICIVVLFKFSLAYGIEELEIQKIFNNVAKHIQTEKVSSSPNILEKKSNKFNIKLTQNADKKFNINSTLKKAKQSFDLVDNATAILFLNKIITKFPYHKNSLIGLGNAYYASKDYKKATEIYIKLLKEYPGDSLISKNFLTIVAEYNADLALSEMLKLYNTHKNYAPLLANLSLIYVEKGDLIKAKEYMIRAVSIDQHNPFYIYNLSIILDKLLDLENAAKLYEKLLNKAIHSPSISMKISIPDVEARFRLIRSHMCI